MLSSIFKRKQPKKFNYIPRFHDKKNHDLIYNRIGDGRFAKRYVEKRKLKEGTATKEENRIDYSSYRTRAKWSSRSPQFNVFLILVGMMLIILIMWMITQPEFTNIFANE